MTAQFDTSAFQWSHGRTPRGFGMWAFDFELCGLPQRAWTPHAMSWSEAKAWVKRSFPSVRQFNACP